MDRISRIVALSEAFGPSGFEDDAAAIVREELPDYETYTDHMTNVRCEKEPASDKPRVMLDAHLDEVGVIVQAIKPNGTMRFLPLGGWAATSFPTSSFRLRTKDGGFVKAVVAIPRIGVIDRPMGGHVRQREQCRPCKDHHESAHAKDRS